MSAKNTHGKTTRRTGEARRSARTAAPETCECGTHGCQYHQDLIKLLEAWDESVRQWRRNHESIPTAFLPFAMATDGLHRERTSASATARTTNDFGMQHNLTNYPRPPFAA